MVQFDIITIFPNMLDSYVNESMLMRAQEKKLLKIETHDLRDFSGDKHHKVDDRQYGGGPGMVLKAEPIYKAVKKIAKKNARVILLSATGKKFDVKAAKRLSTYSQLVFVCGRYEGVDERVAKYIADEELSIGDYVLTGGELPAMVIIDAVSRHILGVLGKQESLEENRLDVGVPVYTRPESMVIDKKKRTVPPVLLSGDHKKIKEWRKKARKK
ncbi:tRNA (guanosine(37)-N1)-methyltransferase TrmD [Candidatus Azambacteria bacterium]|nr:tRNA (guanosine(37)-N1)-methyltransferase TrmD [Candidatus Azambacteria bacterium]MBI3685556.1 tRNA (guanosine(37)-N1)-methyltransferase TrmD [Candidatus Azambacteria bacterium]